MGTGMTAARYAAEVDTVVRCVEGGAESTSE
jgi:hypothetical protein